MLSAWPCRTVTSARRSRRLLGGAARAKRRTRRQPPARRLVRLLVEYYGDGLARVCEIVGADRPDLVHQLAADPLVESQLILHGLHPLDRRQAHRAPRWIGCAPISARTPAAWPSSASTTEGVAQLRLDGSCHGCPSSTVTVQLDDRGGGAARPRRNSPASRSTARCEDAAAAADRSARPGSSPTPTNSVWRHPRPPNSLARAR